MTYIEVLEDVKIKLEAGADWNVPIWATATPGLYVMDFDIYENFLIEEPQDMIDYYIDCFPDKTMHLIDIPDEEVLKP